LIFVNRAPVIWYSKRQNTVEVSTFGSEITAMKNAIELIEALRYKLRMFCGPIDGATNIFCDNEAVTKKCSDPTSTLKKKHHSVYDTAVVSVLARCCTHTKPFILHRYGYSGRSSAHDARQSPQLGDQGGTCRSSLCAASQLYQHCHQVQP